MTKECRAEHTPEKTSGEQPERDTIQATMSVIGVVVEGTAPLQVSDLIGEEL
jgi:hypothetical protein